MYRGDITSGSVLDFKFTSTGTNGVPTTLGGTPSLAVYKGNSATQSTAGISLTADFDSVTGLNHVRIDTSADGTFYAAGNDYHVVLAAGTVGGNSAVGYLVAEFSIENRAGAGVETIVTAIKAKTDNLPTDPADESLIIAATTSLAATLGSPAGASLAADIAAVKSDSGAIKAKTDNLPALPAAVSDIPTANANADALLDRANGVETGFTLRQVLRLMSSVLLGKASGMATNTAVFRDLTDTKARVTATVDSSGNRSAVTKDAS